MINLLPIAMLVLFLQITGYWYSVKIVSRDEIKCKPSDWQISENPKQQTKCTISNRFIILMPECFANNDFFAPQFYFLPAEPLQMQI